MKNALALWFVSALAAAAAGICFGEAWLNEMSTSFETFNFVAAGAFGVVVSAATACGGWIAWRDS
jgi:hypothetical protein